MSEHNAKFAFLLSSVSRLDAVMLATDNKADGSPELQQLPEVKQRNTKRSIKTTVRHGSIGTSTTTFDRSWKRPDTTFIGDMNLSPVTCPLSLSDES